jgi:hypothetical protein
MTGHVRHDECGVIRATVTGGPVKFSLAQRAGLKPRQADQDRNLAVMHLLETNFGAATQGRQQGWRAKARPR